MSYFYNEPYDYDISDDCTPEYAFPYEQEFYCDDEDPYTTISDYEDAFDLEVDFNPYVGCYDYEDDLIDYGRGW